MVREFKQCVQSDIKSFLDEKQVKKLEKTARLADDYSLYHKVSFVKTKVTVYFKFQSQIYNF